MKALALVMVVAGYAGCIDSASVACDDGRVCPAGTQCEATHQLCIVPEQTTACNGLADRAACTFTTQVGTCLDGLCLPTVCGDGVIEGTEQCEGSDLQGVTGCLDLGYYQDGPVSCTVDCRYDRSQCAGICGDGVVDPQHEACDATHDVVVAQCDDATVGFYNPGAVYCNAACQLDTSGCTGSCGDGIINGAEACDGAAPGIGCLGYGYDYGVLGCVRCGPDFTSCGTIGWRDEQFESNQRMTQIMGTSPTDVWATGFDVAYHLVNHVVRQFSLTGGEGDALWIQGSEVFIGGGLQYIRHGVVAANGDVTWTNMALPAPTSAFVTAMWGVGTDDIYAVGHVISTNALEVYHYDGASWTLAMAGPSSAPAVGFWAASASEIWLTTNQLGTGAVWRWTGASWSSVTLPAGLTTSNVINTVWGVDAGHIFLGGMLGVGVSNSGTWTVTPTPTQVLAIHGSSATDAVLGGIGFAWRYDGALWNDISGTATYYALWDDDSTIYAAAENTTSYGVSFTEGSAWESPELTNEPVQTMWVGDGTAVAGSPDSAYQRDATVTWNDTSFNSNARGMWGFSPTDYWAVAESNVSHFDGTWHDLTNNLPALGFVSLTLVWGASSSDLWISGENALYHWNGATWTKTVTTQTPSAIHGLATNDIWVATGTDVVLHYTGASWTTTTAPGGVELLAVYELDPDHVYAVGRNATIAMWDGGTWTLQSNDSLYDFNGVWARTASDVFAIDNGGSLWHYDGMLWRPIRMASFDAATGVTGDADHVYLYGGDGIDVLYRHTPWS